MSSTVRVIRALCRYLDLEEARRADEHQRYLREAAHAAQLELERDEARQIASRLWVYPGQDCLGERQMDLVRAWSGTLDEDDRTLVGRRPKDASCLLCGGAGEVADAGRQDLVPCPGCREVGRG